MKIIRTLLVFMAGATMADTMHADSLVAAESPITETVTLAVNPRPTHAGATIAPSSQLTREQALALASALAKVSGRDIIVASVGPTGSMRPYFDENALLLLEMVPFNDLRVGDVVTFAHPQLATDVVHRLVEKRGNFFWTKGDHNSAMDNIYVTPENFHRRLVGIIYFDSRPVAQVAHSSISLAAAELDKSPTQTSMRKRD